MGIKHLSLGDSIVNLDVQLFKHILFIDVWSILLIVIDHKSMLPQIRTYCKTSSISRTKSKNLDVSCILVQMFSLNPLKPGVKLRMKM